MVVSTHECLSRWLRLLKSTRCQPCKKKKKASLVFNDTVVPSMTSPGSLLRIQLWFRWVPMPTA